MKRKILIFFSILILTILISSICIVINNQISDPAEATCVDIASSMSVCYCILCHEGTTNDFDGLNKCSSDGGTAGPSDDSAAAQGCQIKVSLAPRGACPSTGF